MRQLLLQLLIPYNTFGQPVRTNPYKLDVAVHFSLKLGMTGEKVKSILIVDDTPVAILENSLLKWDGQKRLPAYSTLPYRQ